MQLLFMVFYTNNSQIRLSVDKKGIFGQALVLLGQMGIFLQQW